MVGDVLNRIAAATARHAGSDLYGQLIGSWSIQLTWYDADGNQRSARGEWHF